MHPTAQYGQTPAWTFASLILRLVAAAATRLRASAGAPAATPAPGGAAYLKKSRREKLIVPPRSGVWDGVAAGAHHPPHGRALAGGGTEKHPHGPDRHEISDRWWKSQEMSGLWRTAARKPADRLCLVLTPEVHAMLDVETVAALDQRF